MSKKQGTKKKTREVQKKLPQDEIVKEEIIQKSKESKSKAEDSKKIKVEEIKNIEKKEKKKSSNNTEKNNNFEKKKENTKENMKANNNPQKKKQTKQKDIVDNTVKEEKKENIKETHVKKEKQENIEKIQEKKKNKENIKEEQVNKENEEQENKNSTSDYQLVMSRKKNGIIGKLLIVFFILILLCIIGIFSVPSLIVSNSNKIISGISINGIKIDNLTVEEVKDKLKNISDEIIGSNLKLTMGEYESELNLSLISPSYDLDKAIDEAYKSGRDDNIIKNSYDILMTKYKGKNIEVSTSLNQEELNNIFNNISQELPGRVTQWSYSVDGEKNLIITKGKKGVVIDEETTTEKINESLKNMLKGEKIEKIDLATKEQEPEPIDVDKIHNEIYREPQNAYVTQNPFGVYVHVDGIDFNVDEVKKLIQSNDEEYTIKLTINHPQVMTKDLGQEAFPDILGKTYKTTYSAGDVNRNTNIELAARTVNGTILMPGETFSYNGILGDTTADKGYKPGGAYLNGEVVQSYGGGICQVSSTIYNAVLYANLQVDERYNHSFLSGYVPAGLDATVSYGSKDFKFTNNRKFPIKLVCTAKNGVISATIYGVKQDDDCDVELQSVVTSYIAPSVKYESTNTLKKGVEKVKQSGSSGCKCTVYRTISRNGKQISKEVLHHDVYSAKQKIILRGTKK